MATIEIIKLGDLEALETKTKTRLSWALGLLSDIGTEDWEEQNHLKHPKVMTGKYAPSDSVNRFKNVIRLGAVKRRIRDIIIPENTQRLLSIAEQKESLQIPEPTKLLNHTDHSRIQPNLNIVRADQGGIYIVGTRKTLGPIYPGRFYDFSIWCSYNKTPKTIVDIAFPKGATARTAERILIRDLRDIKCPAACLGCHKQLLDFGPSVKRGSTVNFDSGDADDVD